MKLTRMQLRRLIQESLNMNESVSLIISGVLAAPVLLEGLAHIIEKAGKKFGREKAELRAEKLEHFAHKLHGVYEAPVKFLIKKAAKAAKKEISEDKLQKYTDIIFGIIIACLMTSAGLSIAKHAKHLGAHADWASVGMLILEAVDIGIEGFELSEIVSHLKNPSSHEKLATAIEEHAESHH